MNVVYTRPKVGDLLLIEPALTAWAEEHQSTVNLFLDNPEFTVFFEEHPCISVFANTERRATNAIELDPMQAMTWALNKGLPFAAGYFPQLQINYSGQRVHFTMYNVDPCGYADCVIVAPFSYSDYGNICPPLYFWGTLLANFSLPKISLGGLDDPLLPGTVSLRGLAWHTVIDLLLSCRLLISVETGILHLANPLCERVVFLSSATKAGFADPHGVPQLKVVRSDKPDWNCADVIEAAKEVLSE